MNDTMAHGLDAQRAIEEAARGDLPTWLKEALGVLARHATLFPPLEGGDYEVIAHLYPH